jgi:hypothetical protein
LDHVWGGGSGTAELETRRFFIGACSFLWHGVIEGTSTAVFSHCPLVRRHRMGYYPSGAKATPPIAGFTKLPKEART